MSSSKQTKPGPSSGGTQISFFSVSFRPLLVDFGASFLPWYLRRKRLRLFPSVACRPRVSDNYIIRIASIAATYRYRLEEGKPIIDLVARILNSIFSHFWHRGSISSASITVGARILIGRKSGMALHFLDFNWLPPESPTFCLGRSFSLSLATFFYVTFALPCEK